MQLCCKSNSNNSYTLFLLSVFSVVLVLTSCQENSNVVNVNSRGNEISLGSALTMQDVFGFYDTTNIMGIIDIYNTYQKASKVDSGNLHTFEQSDFQAIATFFKVDTSYMTYSCSGITINGHSLPELASGLKVYANQGDEYFFNFGSGTNRILILNSPPNIPSVDTSLAFPSPLRITSLSRGDTISHDSGLTLLWSGAPSGTEYASLNIIKQTDLDDTTEIPQGNAVIVNSGNFSISSTIMNEFSAGYYDIILTGYHPQFITVSNGNKIAVIYKDKHTITIYIK